MNMLSIMEAYHWSYDEYMNTPQSVIELIIAKSNIDAKKQKNDDKLKSNTF